MHMINVLPASIPAAISLGMFASMILRRRNWRRVADTAAPVSGWTDLPASLPPRNLLEAAWGGQPPAVHADSAVAIEADHACIPAQTSQGLQRRRPVAVLDASGAVVPRQASSAPTLAPPHPTRRHRALRLRRGDPGMHGAGDAQVMSRPAVSRLPRRKRPPR